MMGKSKSMLINLWNGFLKSNSSINNKTLRSGCSWDEILIGCLVEWVMMRKS